MTRGCATYQPFTPVSSPTAPAPWMADSTREQIGKLQTLLADPPLKHLKALG